MAVTEAGTSRSAVELPAVLDNRARRRAGAAAALGRAVAHTALKNGAARAAGCRLWGDRRHQGAGEM